MKPLFLQKVNPCKILVGLCERAHLRGRFEANDRIRNISISEYPKWHSENLPTSPYLRVWGAANK